MSDTKTIDISDPPWALLAHEASPYVVRRNFLGAEYVFFMDLQMHQVAESIETEVFLQNIFETKIPTDLLFNGWVGFMSYDFLAAHAGVLTEAPRDLNFPSAIFARPQTIVRYTDGKSEICSVLPGRCEELVRCATVPFSATVANATSKMQCNLEFEQYREIFQRAREYILDGETYQIKISQRYETETNICPLHAFVHLMKINPAPQSFLWRDNDFSLVSCSPETVINVQDGIGGYGLVAVFNATGEHAPVFLMGAAAMACGSLLALPQWNRTITR